MAYSVAWSVLRDRAGARGRDPAGLPACVSTTSRSARPRRVRRLAAAHRRDHGAQRTTVPSEHVPEAGRRGRSAGAGRGRILLVGGAADQARRGAPHAVERGAPAVRPEVPRAVERGPPGGCSGDRRGGHAQAPPACPRQTAQGDRDDRAAFRAPWGVPGVLSGKAGRAAGPAAFDRAARKPRGADPGAAAIGLPRLLARGLARGGGPGGGQGHRLGGDVRRPDRAAPGGRHAHPALRLDAPAAAARTLRRRRR